MLLIPLWPKESLKFPFWTLVLVIANIFIFLLTWPAQMKQTSHVGQDDLQMVSRKMIVIILDATAGLSLEEKQLLEKDATSDNCPTEISTGFFERVQNKQILLSQKNQYDWELLYPLYESYRKSTSVNPHLTTPFKEWGFNPEKNWWPGLLTHQFLHAGWFHLIFNLIFLWMAASIAEDSLGLHVVWVYGVGGIAAAIAQVQYGIPSGRIMVGASGAIAALMGFCFFARSHVKVKLAYVLFLLVFFRVGVFNCPLWFFLPIWFLTQMAMAGSVVDSSALTTAYAAHLGGFLFGCVMGFVWKKFEVKPQIPR